MPLNVTMTNLSTLPHTRQHEGNNLGAADTTPKEVTVNHSLQSNVTSFSSFDDSTGMMSRRSSFSNGSGADDMDFDGLGPDGVMSLLEEFIQREIDQIVQSADESEFDDEDDKSLEQVKPARRARTQEFSVARAKKHIKPHQPSEPKQKPEGTVEERLAKFLDKSSSAATAASAKSLIETVRKISSAAKEDPTKFQRIASEASIDLRPKLVTNPSNISRASRKSSSRSSNNRRSLQGEGTNCEGDEGSLTIPVPPRASLPPPSSLPPLPSIPRPFSKANQNHQPKPAPKPAPKPTPLIQTDRGLNRCVRSDPSILVGGTNTSLISPTEAKGMLSRETFRAVKTRRSPRNVFNTSQIWTTVPASGDEEVIEFEQDNNENTPERLWNNQNTWELPALDDTPNAPSLQRSFRKDSTTDVEAESRCLVSETKNCFVETSAKEAPIDPFKNDGFPSRSFAPRKISIQRLASPVRMSIQPPLGVTAANELSTPAQSGKIRHVQMGSEHHCEEVEVVCEAPLPEQELMSPIKSHGQVILDFKEEGRQKERENSDLDPISNNLEEPQYSLQDKHDPTTSTEQHGTTDKAHSNNATRGRKKKKSKLQKLKPHLASIAMRIQAVAKKRIVNEESLDAPSKEEGRPPTVSNLRVEVAGQRSREEAPLQSNKSMSKKHDNDVVLEPPTVKNCGRKKKRSDWKIKWKKPSEVDVAPQDRPCTAKHNHEHSSDKENKPAAAIFTRTPLGGHNHDSLGGVASATVDEGTDERTRSLEKTPASSYMPSQWLHGHMSPTSVLDKSFTANMGRIESHASTKMGRVASHVSTELLLELDSIAAGALSGTRGYEKHSEGYQAELSEKENSSPKEKIESIVAIISPRKDTAVPDPAQQDEIIQEEAGDELDAKAKSKKSIHKHPFNVLRQAFRKTSKNTKSRVEIGQASISMENSLLEVAEDEEEDGNHDGHDDDGDEDDGGNDKFPSRSGEKDSNSICSGETLSTASSQSSMDPLLKNLSSKRCNPTGYKNMTKKDRQHARQLAQDMAILRRIDRGKRNRKSGGKGDLLARAQTVEASLDMLMAVDTLVKDRLKEHDKRSRRKLGSKRKHGQKQRQQRRRRQQQQQQPHQQATGPQFALFGISPFDIADIFSCSCHGK